MLFCFLACCQVGGEAYELKEIYGMDQTADDESAADCVVCMTEPRNTTVLPCRYSHPAPHHLTLVLRFSSRTDPPCIATATCVCATNVHKRCVCKATRALFVALVSPNLHGPAARDALLCGKLLTT